MLEDSSLERDEISISGEILNSKTEVLVGFSVEHRTVREGGYRFAPPKNIVDVRNLCY